MCFYHDHKLRNIDFRDLGWANQAEWSFLKSAAASNDSLQETF